MVRTHVTLLGICMLMLIGDTSQSNPNEFSSRNCSYRFFPFVKVQKIAKSKHLKDTINLTSIPPAEHAPVINGAVLKIAIIA